MTQKLDGTSVYEIKRLHSTHMRLKPVLYCSILTEVCLFYSCLCNTKPKKKKKKIAILIDTSKTVPIGSFSCSLLGLFEYLQLFNQSLY